MKFHFEKSVSYGVATHAGIGIRRIMAKNPGPFTYHGTGTYIIGKGEVAVIDPGPDIPSHVNSLLDALDGEKVSHILVTHTHRDHSPAANALKLATGAETYGFGPHSRNKGPSVEEGADYDFIPDIATIDGDIIEGRDFCFEAIHTPGHTSNHLCFSLKKHGVLFPGDHVMGWSTTVVSPPDGNMALYRSSLQRLLERDEKIYLPTHGPAILNPYEYVSSLLAHRNERENSIVSLVDSGINRVPEIVDKIYIGLDPKLHTAAQRSVLAHLIQLVNEGKIQCTDENIRINARFISS